LHEKDAKKMARAHFWTVAIIAGLASGYASAADPTASSPIDISRSMDGTSDQGPSVSIARRVVDAAGAFERYFRTANAVSPDFDGAASVSGALMSSAAYDTRQLQEGAVAYASLVALQEPTFVNALSSFAGDQSERAAYVERLTATPELVLELPGAAQAAAMASGALNEMGSSLVSRGRAVKHAAYTVQHQPWALEPVAEPAERLARVEAQGVQPRLSESETHQLMASIVARRGGQEDASAAVRPTPTVLHGLALAAAAVLGQAGENRAGALSPLLGEIGAAACLTRAKQNFHQCVAASGPQYEDVYCAGEHAMAETGQCIVAAAGGTTAPDGVKVPVARVTSGTDASASVSVPVALKARAIPDVDRAPDAAKAPEVNKMPEVEKMPDVEKTPDDARAPGADQPAQAPAPVWREVRPGYWEGEAQ